jgi:hypothetical protein
MTKLWLVIYLAGKITGIVGPLPESPDVDTVCQEYADNINFKVKNHAEVDQTLHAVCERRDIAPVCENCEILR